MKAAGLQVQGMRSKLRWRRYEGTRTPRAGWRAFVELPPSWHYGPIHRRYAYIWEEGGSVVGYYESEAPGEVVDVEIGPTASQERARELLEHLLRAKYPNHLP